MASGAPVNVTATEKGLIDISNLELEALPTELVATAPNAVQLHAENNKLTKLANAVLFQLINCEYLHVEFNELEALPSSIENLRKLIQLHAAFNKLTTVPPQIASLRTLTRLYLNDNKLTSLPEEIGNVQSLEELRIDNNPDLGSLPGTIVKLQYLQILSANCCGLEALPEDALPGLQNLRELYVDENELAELPESIGTVRKLKVLHANDNKLTSLPPTLSKLSRLERLYINNIQLRNPRQELGALKLPNLRELVIKDMTNSLNTRWAFQ